MGYGYTKDMVKDRTTLEESPSMSKAVRRYGVNGSKGDFTHGSTGGNAVHESDIAPSAAARSVKQRAVVQAKTAGWSPDGSGKWLGASHPNTGKHDGGHPGARGASTDGASGQANAANSKFGKPTLRPAASNNTGTRPSPAAVLNGEKKL